MSQIVARQQNNEGAKRKIRQLAFNLLFADKICSATFWKDEKAWQ